MSGPKVIHVVPRQVVIDICTTAIAEAEHALVEWQRIMDRNMISAPTVLKDFSDALNDVRGMFAADQFLEVQKAAPELTAAIQSNGQQQLAAHASEAASRKRQERSLRLSAEAVLARAREGELELPEECVRILSDAAAARSVAHDAVQHALSQANAALYAKEDNSPSQRQLELAGALGATGETTTAANVLRNAEDSLLDPRVARITSLVADFASLGEDDIAAEFSSRLEKVNQADTKGDTQQTNLLLSSLEIDIAPALKKAREFSALRHDIGVEIAASQATNDWEACSKDLREAQTAVERGEADLARRHIEQAKKLRSERQKQRAAQSSRAAILDGLKALGYEVREGMATQWAENKQLVVRHAAKPGVALELAGTLEGGRLQARMVALQGSARDPHADKQTEEKWCSELDSLRKHISGRGGEITIVKAVAAGAAPLKVVADEQHDEERWERQVRERGLH